ncbi:conserved hypothetical protein [Aurantimonas manganoxydans SI85-9A1]|uniref:Polysaccharide deacetylase n=1 Tax=Aurantimonas manganoxydans (strain ATCC BAA-1229 / DSM 21871 / SI85-9A1) TaxID=287752 RepID=Q1YDH9_AURMS|nr:hypothetical protein [Aurantimonas manganoxydans]EAS48318.1 conserved hypothetical protein [Aurantimonas manganoxydans SI85-9A1]
MSAADFPLARRQLDAAGVAGVELAFWWRDDDARGATPELARLLAQRRETGVPLALAVIPDRTRPDLLDGMTADDDIRLFLHGWCHANHAPAGEKRAEFGDHRPAAAMLEDISRGRDRLAALADGRFLPVFVPPWNRIGPGIAARLGETGLSGLSVFARPASRHCVHTHLDLMDWRAGRAQDAATLDRLLAAQIAARLAGGGATPAGIPSAAPMRPDMPTEAPARMSAGGADPIAGETSATIPSAARMRPGMPAEVPARTPAGGPEPVGGAPSETQPIGLLTHHLQHDAAAWERLAALLTQLAPRPGVVWPKLPDLFALQPVTRPRS